MRLQAADRDTKGTDAWKVKYAIRGKLADHFRIDTNPVTNEGVMYVIKVLFWYYSRVQKSIFFKHKAPFDTASEKMVGPAEKALKALTYLPWSGVALPHNCLAKHQWDSR